MKSSILPIATIAYPIVPPHIPQHCWKQRKMNCTMKRVDSDAALLKKVTVGSVTSTGERLRAQA